MGPIHTRLTSPISFTQHTSPRRHKRGEDNHSVPTIRSVTSEEESKQKPWGEEVLVGTEYSKTRDERLFALLDSASHRSWISTEALETLGVSSEVGKDGMGIQPVSDNATKTRTIAGDVKAYGTIKLSYRCIAGPSSTKRYKAWFHVADHSDLAFQVLLGQDFPGLQTDIANLSLVTISHPKTKSQKVDDATRAKKHEERKKRLKAGNTQTGDCTDGSSHTKNPPDIPSDGLVSSKSAAASTTTQ